MPLHPQSKAVLDIIAAQGGPPLEQMTPAELRASRAETANALAELFGPAQPVARVEDRSVPGPAQSIPIRSYWPEAGKTLPVLVYFHGGGWVFGNLDQVDRACRALAKAVPCVVVNVDYRLAPEHKFPPPPRTPTLPQNTSPNTRTNSRGMRRASPWAAIAQAAISRLSLV